MALAKYGRRCAVCSSVSQNSSLMPSLLQSLNQFAPLTSIGLDPNHFASLDAAVAE